MHIPQEKNACLSADRDPLFLGVFNVVSCCVLRIPCRVQIGTHHRESTGKKICLFIEDLKADTADLESYVQLRKEKKIMMDSLMMLLN
ncbi:MAG: hypothetical protein SGI96_18330, partial [Bacteroidota bacterium]|nr:hypothetical protein [Bacteroidota bacterium]MDZ4810199.1 hypothetical protein [Bacteroidota bacterium]